MCLAMPGKVVTINKEGNSLGPTAKVDFGGAIKEISLACLPETQVGDYVIVHVGMALSRLDEEEARKSLELWNELNLLNAEEKV
jgi:hydrogenase expression/formation protein HypC